MLRTINGDSGLNRQRRRSKNHSLGAWERGEIGRLFRQRSSAATQSRFRIPEGESMGFPIRDSRFPKGNQLGFPIRDSGFPKGNDSGIRNLESGISNPESGIPRCAPGAGSLRRKTLTLLAHHYLGSRLFPTPKALDSTAQGRRKAAPWEAIRSEHPYPNGVPQPSPPHRPPRYPVRLRRPRAVLCNAFGVRTRWWIVSPRYPGAPAATLGCVV